MEPAECGGALMMVRGDKGCASQGAEPMRFLGGGGGGTLPSSLAGDERDSVEVQPLARPPTLVLRCETLTPRVDLRELRGARRRL